MFVRYPYPLVLACLIAGNFSVLIPSGLSSSRVQKSYLNSNPSTAYLPEPSRLPGSESPPKSAESSSNTPISSLSFRNNGLAECEEHRCSNSRSTSLPKESRMLPPNEISTSESPRTDTFKQFGGGVVQTAKDIRARPSISKNQVISQSGTAQFDFAPPSLRTHTYDGPPSNRIENPLPSGSGSNESVDDVDITLPNNYPSRGGGAAMINQGAFTVLSSRDFLVAPDETLAGNTHPTDHASPTKKEPDPAASPAPSPKGSIPPVATGHGSPSGQDPPAQSPPDQKKNDQVQVAPPNSTPNPVDSGPEPKPAPSPAPITLAPNVPPKPQPSKQQIGIHSFSEAFHGIINQPSEQDHSANQPKEPPVHPPAVIPPTPAPEAPATLPVIINTPIQKQKNGNLVVGSVTVAPGLQTTVFGHAISNRVGQVAVDGKTFAAAGPIQTTPLFVNNQVVHMTDGRLEIGSQTLIPGSLVTLYGHIVDYANPSRVIVDGTTHGLASIPSTQPFVIGGQTLSRGSKNAVVVAGSTIAANGVATVAGHTYSFLGAGQVIENGQTYALPQATNAYLVQALTNNDGHLSTAPFSFDNSLVITPESVMSPGANPTFRLPNGAAISAGGTPIVLSGTTYSVLPSGQGFLVNGKSTLPLPIITTGQDPVLQPFHTILTVDGTTFTANPTGFHVGSQSVIPGGKAIVVDGTTISLDRQSHLKIGTSTLDIGPEHPTATSNIITIGGQAVTAAASGFTIDGKTISPGGSAVTISGTVISLDRSSHLAIGSSTVLLTASRSIPASVTPSGASTTKTPSLTPSSSPEAPTPASSPGTEAGPPKPTKTSGSKGLGSDIFRLETGVLAVLAVIYILM